MVQACMPLFNNSGVGTIQVRIIIEPWEKYILIFLIILVPVIHYYVYNICMIAIS